MIPATTPYVARYRQTFDRPDGSQGSYIADKPVIAWDDDGEALVAASERGRLVLASGYSNFEGLDTADPHVVAALPGAGWLAEYKEDDGTLFRFPVTAWLVSSDGSCKPVKVDADGYSDDARDSANFVRLITPGEQEVEA